MAKRKQDCDRIESQAVIVITIFRDKGLVIRTDNDSTSGAAKFADSAAKLLYHAANFKDGDATFTETKGPQ